jgi:hypothetical protein
MSFNRFLLESSAVVTFMVTTGWTLLSPNVRIPYSVPAFRLAALIPSVHVWCMCEAWFVVILGWCRMSKSSTRITLLVVTVRAGVSPNRFIDFSRALAARPPIDQWRTVKWARLWHYYYLDELVQASHSGKITQPLPSQLSDFYWRKLRYDYRPGRWRPRFGNIWWLKSDRYQCDASSIGCPGGTNDSQLSPF